MDANEKLTQLLHTPEFSEPKTVMKNAREAYKVALENNHPVQAIEAAIQFTIAQNEITSDSTVTIYSMLRALPSRLEAPYAQVACLLEASYLQQMYRSNSYNYDNRQLPADELSDNPKEWSGEQFKTRIDELCRKALEDSENTSAMPIDKIKDIIEWEAGPLNHGLTVYDFIVYNTIDLLAVAHRFSPEKYEAEKIRLIDTLIARNEERARDSEEVKTGALLMSRLYRLGYESGDTMPSIKRLMEEYQKSDVYYIVLACIYNEKYSQFSESDKQWFYQVVTNELNSKRNPETDKDNRQDILQYIKDCIEVSNLNISMPERVLPANPIKVHWESNTCRDFYLLLVELPQKYNTPYHNGNPQPDLNIVRKAGRLVDKKRVRIDSPTPFAENGDIEFGGVKSGYYAVVASKDGTLNGVTGNRWSLTTVNVCGLTYFKVANKEGTAIYVVSAENGAPIRDCKVETFNDKVFTGTLRTDIDGKVTVGLKISSVTLYNGNDKLSFPLREYWYDDFAGPQSDRRQVTILTDLAIYHPGDTIEGVAIAAHCKANRVSALPEEKLKVRLIDVNCNEADSAIVSSGNDGRASFSLRIPETGMTGMYIINVNPEDSNTILGLSTIQVADYKAPTFRVILERPVIDDKDDVEKPVRLKGNVCTYSGMPLSDTKVSVKLSFSTWWQRSAGIDDTLLLETTTDAEGNFEVEIGVDTLREKQMRYGVFTATASATSAAGETHDSASVRFSLGEHYTIGSEISSQIEVANGAEYVELPVYVANAVGNRVERKIEYRIEGTFGSKAILTGETSTGTLLIPSASLPSGEYKVTLSDIRNKDDRDENRMDSLVVNTIIWRKSDTVAPSSSPVWVPEKIIYATRGSKSVRVDFGNAWRDGYIYVIDSENNFSVGQSLPKVAIRRVNAEMTYVEVEAPAPGHRRRLTFIGMHRLDMAQTEVEVRPADENVKVSIIPVTFRDHIAPSSSETWKFVIKTDENIMPFPAVMSVMSNKALNDIVPFRWRFSPQSMRNFPYPLKITTGSYIGDGYFSTSWKEVGKYVNLNLYNIPEFRLYGHSLYSEYGVYTRGIRMYSKSSRLTSDNMEMSMDMDVMEEAEVMNSVAGYDGAPLAQMKIRGRHNVVADDLADEEVGVSQSEGYADHTGDMLRDIECPVAFFKPLLKGDEKGEVELSFEVPNFNTEWQLQLIAYNPGTMDVGFTMLSAVASKPVMIQTNMPRFLRTGDHAYIEAMIFNNSDERQVIEGKMEIFDVLTGKVVKSQVFAGEDMAASASRKVSIFIEVPDDVNMLGVRAVAKSELGCDGEQSGVAVLPSSQPVYDAITRYLGKGYTSMSMVLPVMDRNAAVSLEFCDNPLWYVLMSLNDIREPEGESAIMIADALYSNQVGAGIMRRYPSISEAVKKACEDESEAVSSPLVNNNSVAMEQLGNTPWVNNALAESARMRNLSGLADSVAVNSAATALLRRLGDLQGADGGWSWCKNMPSSLFMTEEVIYRYAAMKSAGDLPSEAENQIKRGIIYCDREIERIWKELKKNGNKYHVSYGDIEYFYIRNRFDYTESSIIKTIKNETVAMIKKNWKDYDVSMKCMAAMMLAREGEWKTARDIMESVRQYASSSPTKGVWFDGATGALSRTSPVMSAAIALLAYHRIMPGDEIIRGLRQYLMLSRQTQDWHMNLCDSKAVVISEAIMATSDPAEFDFSGNPEIFIDGKQLDLSESAGLPGSILINLNPSDVSGKRLEIHRQGNTPAWGGVIMSYVQPIKDIKPRAPEQLKVTKSLYPVVSEDGHTKVGKATSRFKKGDRVRVTMTVSTDRDLDYLMIRDERGAWMEPLEQLTVNSYDDGIWQVREQRTSYANIYIHHLPKGVYVFSYEVTADREGEYTSGTATAQSLYYPLITARSGIIEAKISDR